MSKGSIPVNYIIAIVLGIVILALLGYWIYRSFGTTVPVVDETACRGKLIQYCTFWSNYGYNPSKMPNGKTFYAANNECEPLKKKLTNDKDDPTDTCKELSKQK